MRVRQANQGCYYQIYKQTSGYSAKRALPFSQAGTIHPISFMRTDKWSPAKRRRINPDFFE